MMPSEPNPPLVTLVSLTKRFGPVTAVKNLDLQVRTGESVALFGPNGAGKTTLLQLIAGLIHPDAGRREYHLNAGLSARRHLGYVSHKSLIYNELTGLENLTFFARLYGLSRPKERSHAMLEGMGLTQAQDRPAGTYSSGMKQRLSLARALIHQPSLLLLDEPYAGLDQKGSRLLTETLNKLHQENRTIFLITHNLSEGLALASRVLIMNRGRLVHEAPAETLDASLFENFYSGVVGD